MILESASGFLFLVVNSIINAYTSYILREGSFLQNRCQKYQSTIARLNEEVSSLQRQLDQLRPDLVITAKEDLTLANKQDEGCKTTQYERCLDDVANQVVKAIMAQKVSLPQHAALLPNCPIDVAGGDSEP